MSERHINEHDSRQWTMAESFLVFQDGVHAVGPMIKVREVRPGDEASIHLVAGYIKGLWLKFDMTDDPLILSALKYLGVQSLPEGTEVGESGEITVPQSVIERAAGYIDMFGHSDDHQHFANYLYDLCGLLPGGLSPEAEVAK